MNPALKLEPFQEKGANWLVSRPAAMLVWDPGVGKTPPTCVACERARAKRVLVFCPPIATQVWHDHFHDWTRFFDRIEIAGPGATLDPKQFVQGNGVRIIGYSRAREHSSLMREVRAAAWDVLILDETHHLKNPDAERTRVIYGSACTRSDGVKASHTWCLTGTPVLNHAAEFWTHLFALVPDTIQTNTGRAMNYEQFITRYTHAVRVFNGWRFYGSKHTDELNRRIRPFVHRQRVSPDMPPLRVVETSLPPLDERDHARLLSFPPHYDDERSDYDKVQRALAGEDNLLLATLQTLSHSTLRRMLGEAKAPMVADYVASLLDDAAETEKVIVFAHHQSVLDILQERLKVYDPLRIDGNSGLEKFVFTGKFQNDPKRRLILLAIEAASEAITLTAARNIIFAEASWTPARNAQGIGRAYRKGQTFGVLARFMTLPNSLDQRIMAVLARKTRDIASVLGGKEGLPGVALATVARAEFPPN